MSKHFVWSAKQHIENIFILSSIFAQSSVTILLLVALISRRVSFLKAHLSGTREKALFLKVWS